ncbi:MAG: CARDB domain-containing protein, partial [Acidobacteriota bacterium]
DVELTWSAVADAARYDLFRDGVKFAERVDLGDLGELRLVDPRLPNGTYVYTARAVDAADNESAPSNEAPATVAVEAPAAPILSVATADPGELRLGWTPGVGPDPFGYRIFRSLQAGGPYAEIDTVGDEIQYLDGGLEAGSVYFYVVEAFDRAGNAGPRSNEASGVPEGAATADASVSLHFPTIPGRVFVTDLPTTTVAGRAASGEDISIRRDGTEVATTAARSSTSALTVISDISTNRILSPSPDSRFAWARGRTSGHQLIDFETGDVRDFAGLGGGPGRFDRTGRFVYVCEQLGDGAQLTRIDLQEDTATVLDSATWFAVAAPSPVADNVAVLAQRGGDRGLWLYDPDTDVWTLAEPASASIFDFDERSLSWSPDGSRVTWVQGGEGGGVFVYHLGSGTARRIADEPAYGVPLFSPDGRELAFVGDTSGGVDIDAYDFATDSISTLASDFVVRWFDWSPDGRAILYHVVGEGTFLYVQDIASGDREMIYTSDNFSPLVDWTPLGFIVTADFPSHAVRLDPAGRFQADDVPLVTGDNELTATDSDGTSEPIVISTGAEAELPDLTVQLSVIPGALFSGDALRATATVRNIGVVEASAAGLRMALSGPDGLVLELADGEVVGPLAPGGAAVVAREITLTGDVGEYSAVAVVDPDGAVVEASEANNLDLETVQVVTADGPTLDLSTDRPLYGIDDDVVTTVEVIGGAGLFSGELDLFIEDDAGFLVASLGSRPVDDLQVGEVRVEEARWNTGPTFAGTYRVQARLRDGADGADGPDLAAFT